MEHDFLLAQNQESSALGSFFFEPEDQSSLQVHSFHRKEVDLEQNKLFPFEDEFLLNDHNHIENNFEYNDSIPLTKKIQKTPAINAFLWSKLMNINPNLNHNEKKRLCTAVYEALYLLEWDLEQCLEIFDDFYYDVNKKELEPLEKIIFDEELENNEIYFLHLYEQESHGMILAANLAKDFWEKDERKKRKKGTKRRIKMKRRKSLNTTQKQIEKLMKERELFYNPGIDDQEKEKNDNNVKFHIKAPISGNYSLRVKKQKKYVNENENEDIEINHEEAKIFNRRFKKKYSQLLNSKKEQKTTEEEKKDENVKTPKEVSQQQLIDQLSKKTLVSLNKQKNKFRSCFIDENEETNPRNNDKEVANSKTDTVMLSELGTLNKKKPTKIKQRKIKAKTKKNPKKLKKESDDEFFLNNKPKTRKHTVIKEIIDVDNHLPPQPQFDLTNIVWEFNCNINEL